MLRASSLIIQIRGRLHDMAKTTFSDWEIIEGINRAVHILFSLFSSRRLNIGVKSATITILNGSSVLPDDFMSIKDVRQENSLTPSTRSNKRFGEYRIIGNSIEAADGEYILEYYFAPPKIFSEVDNLDIHGSLEQAIVNVAAETVKRNEEGALAIANFTAGEQSGREISYYQRIGPVQIWGGK